MSWLKVVVVVAGLTLVYRSTGASEITCEKLPGYLAGPLVPTRDAAAEILTIVSTATMKRVPMEAQIRVEDRGKNWGVWEDPTLTGKPKMVGGGLLSMRIDKCDGRITQVYFQK